MTKQPEITGNKWFNSKPLKPEDLAGKVVLVDFWTYSCVNCFRTLPYLRNWWDKYKDKGFIIIGVHTPEFDFERIPKNVETAIKDFKIEWPVVLDSDYENWDKFGNRYWPAKYISDQRGYIVYTHFGEGNYAETEKIIRSLIENNLGKKLLYEAEENEHNHGKVCFLPTPELYCGYARGSLSNPAGYIYDRIAVYTGPVKLNPDSIALKGRFYAAPEYVETAAPGAALLLRFKATEVNLVLNAPVGGTTAEILLDGKPLPETLRGKDINSHGEVVIDKPKMYNLLLGDDLVEGVLSVRLKTGNFQAYAFTFSGCRK